MTPLLERVIELADLRARAAKSREQLRVRYEEFNRANAGLIENVKEQASAVDSAEVALRAVALERYDITKDKKPAPGVEIKMFKEYTIDEEAGLAWAKEKQLCLIPAKLDVAAIKKLATVQPLPFVLVDEVPKVTLAVDLSKLDLKTEAASTVAPS